MAVASIEVSGSGAERLVTELRVSLVAAAEPGDSVSPVEVDRSPELVEPDTIGQKNRHRDTPRPALKPPIPDRLGRADHAEL